MFLKRNFLILYNDVLIVYLNYLIKKEQIKIQADVSNKRLLFLHKERQKHQKAIKIIMRNLNSNIGNWEDVSEVAID